MSLMKACAKRPSGGTPRDSAGPMQNFYLRAIRNRLHGTNISLIYS